MALVPRCPLVAKDVMGSTEHHHVREVVAKAQEPETHHVPPKGAPTVQQRGQRFRGGLLPLGIQKAPPRARTASHGIKFRSREGFEVSESPELAPTGRVRVFKSSCKFGPEVPQVGGSRDSARGALITCLEVTTTSGSSLCLGFRLSQPRGGGQREAGRTLEPLV